MNGCEDLEGNVHHFKGFGDDEGSSSESSKPVALSGVIPFPFKFKYRGERLFNLFFWIGPEGQMGKENWVSAMPIQTVFESSNGSDQRIESFD